MDRPYDVVIWGATGFTGKIVAAYFQDLKERKALGGIRFALAGRNAEKLKTVLKQIKSEAPIVIASLTNEDSLAAMCASTRVLLSTVGPFMKYGTPVVAACVQQGTDYVDTTGETPWVRELIDRFHASARGRKTFIVPMCGFDSIPSDLGAYITAAEIKKRVMAYSVLYRMPSSALFLLFALCMMERQAPHRLHDVFVLGGQRKCGVREEDKDFNRVEFHEGVGMWATTFGMAKLNTRVVRRSNSLFEAEGLGYGDNFNYQEKALVPTEKIAKKVWRAANAPPDVIERMIKQGRLPTPGKGPSKAERKKNWFIFTMDGTSEDGRHVRTEIKGGDAGYEETAKMVAESAILLASKKGELLKRKGAHGGVVTPAFAFGRQLVDRLVAAGIHFHASPTAVVSKL
eukprot:jgi/Bigna1/91029/estExt_fgenesh1_pg.C_860039